MSNLLICLLLERARSEREIFIIGMASVINNGKNIKITSAFHHRLGVDIGSNVYFPVLHTKQPNEPNERELKKKLNEKKKYKMKPTWLRPLRRRRPNTLKPARVSSSSAAAFATAPRCLLYMCVRKQFCLIMAGKQRLISRQFNEKLKSKKRGRQKQ